MEKQITVSRVNPLVRIPAVLFKGIDKRKRRIPLVVDYDNGRCIVKIDVDKIKGE